MFSPVTSMTLQPFTVRLAYQRVRWSTYISQCVSVPHRALCEELLSHKPCWTSHLKNYVNDLFRSSSGEVFLWKSAKVPALQCLVNSMNEGVNHLPHVRSEWVKGEPLGQRALEMPVLVALGTKKPLLGHSDI